MEFLMVGFDSFGAGSPPDLIHKDCSEAAKL